MLHCQGIYQQWKLSIHKQLLVFQASNLSRLRIVAAPNPIQISQVSQNGPKTYYVHERRRKNCHYNIPQAAKRDWTILVQLEARKPLPLVFHWSSILVLVWTLFLLTNYLPLLANCRPQTSALAIPPPLSEAPASHNQNGRKQQCVMIGWLKATSSNILTGVRRLSPMFSAAVRAALTMMTDDEYGIEVVYMVYLPVPRASECNVFWNTNIPDWQRVVSTPSSPIVNNSFNVKYINENLHSDTCI